MAASGNEVESAGISVHRGFAGLQLPAHGYVLTLGT